MTSTTVPILKHTGDFTSFRSTKKEGDYPYTSITWQVKYGGKQIPEFVKLGEVTMSGFKTKVWPNGGRTEHSLMIYLDPTIPDQKETIDVLLDLHKERCKMVFESASKDIKKKLVNAENAANTIRPVLFRPDDEDENENAPYIMKLSMYKPTSPIFKFPTGVETLDDGKKIVKTRRMTVEELSQTDSRRIRITGKPVIRWRDIFIGATACKDRVEIVSCMVSDITYSDEDWDQDDDAQEALEKNPNLADLLSEKLKVNAEKRAVASTSSAPLSFPGDDEEGHEEEDDEEATKFMTAKPKSKPRKTRQDDEEDVTKFMASTSKPRSRKQRQEDDDDE